MHVPTATVDGPAGDPVALSVAAYSPHVADYTAQIAAVVTGPVQRFANLLAPGSSVLDAGCGPGRDLAPCAAFGPAARVDGTAASAAGRQDGQRRGSSPVQTGYSRLRG